MNGGHDRVDTHDGFLAYGVSVVVDNLDTVGSSVRPTEADTPLLIDADTVGARPIALELLEPVSRRHPQIIECLGSIQDEQLPQRRALGALIELAHPLSSPDPLGLLIRERPQHTRHDDNARRYERRTLYERSAAARAGRAPVTVATRAAPTLHRDAPQANAAVVVEDRANAEVL